VKPTAKIEPLLDVSQVESLAAVARAEGFNFLDRLIDEWQNGTNKFEKPSEVIYGAFVDGNLIATAGLTFQRENLGRVRRVYVHPNYRRQGIAKSLMNTVLSFAQEQYSTVVLYTETQEAREMYERLGFIPESPDGPDHATHRLQFD
jgi:predicted GNAT family acetyltransferase